MPKAPWIIQRDDINVITMCLERAMLTIHNIGIRKDIRRMLDAAEEAQKQ